MLFIPFIETHSEAIKLWDESLNSKTTPEEYSFGSNYIAWWSSDICGHSWQRAIKNQIKNSDCPTCKTKASAFRAGSTKKNNTGRLDLIAPILSKEWSVNNKLQPYDFSVKSYVKALWTCSICSHEWEAFISERVNGRGKCKNCSNQLFKAGVNDFVTLNSKLSEELTDLGLSNAKYLLSNSRKRVEWCCSNCGYVWNCAPYFRLKGRGCPECSKKNQSSTGELEVINFLESKGYEIKASYRFSQARRLEVDIFLPHYSIAIEYNGEYWHSDEFTQKRWGITAYERHSEKFRLCLESNIKLFYVWESDWRDSKEKIEASIIKAIETGVVDNILAKFSSETDSLEP